MGQFTKTTLKLAIATVGAIVSALALVGVSGMIVFADLKAPSPTELAAGALRNAPAVGDVKK